MQAGADDYLIKPFSARELLARVEAHLNMARFRHEATQCAAPAHGAVRNAAQPGAARRLPGRRGLPHPRTSIPSRGRCSATFPAASKAATSDEITRILWERSYADEIVAIFRHTLETGEPYITSERAELRARSRRDRNTTNGGSIASSCPTAASASSATSGTLPSRCKRRTRASFCSTSSITASRTRWQACRQSCSKPCAAPGIPPISPRVSRGRIQSLSRAHSLLTDSTWQGADLRELIHDQLLARTGR